MTRLLLLLSLALFAAGCGATAKHLGGEVAEGAIEEAKSEAEEGAPADAAGAPPEEAKGAGTGGAGAAGTDATVQPSPLAGTSFEKMGLQLGEGAAEGALRRLTEQVGPEGAGPFGEALGAASSQITSAAMASATEELAVSLGCEGQPTPQCLEARAQALGSAAAKGMMDRIRWPILIATFVAGAVCSAAFAQLGRLAARLVERRRSAP